MKMQEFIEKTEAAMPAELAEVLMSEMSIWTNDACRGYCIEALENVGMDREKIKEVLNGLRCAFDDMNVEEAEQKWYNW